jgi:hypothetical protein
LIVLIKAISIIAGPGLVATSGQVVDVADTMAIELIKGGFAVPAKTAATVETATVEPQENAAQPPKAATRRGKSK